MNNLQKIAEGTTSCFNLEFQRNATETKQAAGRSGF